MMNRTLRFPCENEELRFAADMASYGDWSDHKNHGRGLWTPPPAHSTVTQPQNQALDLCTRKDVQIAEHSTVSSVMRSTHMNLSASSAGI